MTEDFPKILPLLVEEDTFLYPFMIAPIFLQNNASIKAVAYAKNNKSLVFIACQKDKLNDNEAPYYDVGVIGSIMREANMPNGRVKLLFNGIAKGRILEPAKENEQGFLEAQISPIEYLEYDKENIQAIVEVLKEKVITLANVSSLFPPDLIKALEDNDDPNRIADLIAAALHLKRDQAYSLFANNNTEQRLLDLIDIVIEETKTQKLQKEIKSKVHQKMEQTNKEYFLKEQLKQIQKELGTDKQRDEDLNQYYQKLESVKPFLKEEAFKEIKKQIDRLSRTHADSSDSATLQNYIETMLDVPFGQYGKKALDIKHVREQLDNDHYSLKRPKERIVEYFATMQLLEMRHKKKQEKKDKAKGTILCFYGPPGVGKTSLANSIAKAIERPLVRIALGGLEDVNELRGHRRTYIGSMPGRIVQGLIEAKKMNPVMVLDEIDKVDRSVRGDPASALLEILDPEQNIAFRDHYANFSIDLSQVIFIATANNIDRIPAPLRDRMEFISVSSYTPSEKEEIAKNYLIPQELEKHALKPSEVDISHECLKLIIEKYTREAGVRDLRRQIATIMRKVALKYLEDNPHKKGRTKKGEDQKGENEENKKRDENKDFCVSITPNNLKEYLERMVFEIDPIDGENKIGIVNGLAWTPVGGDVLKIEAVKIRGKGELKLTGSLGDVMKESAIIAFSVVKALLDNETLKAPKIPSETDAENKKKKKALKVYNAYDLHLHVPEGATPKDGPSAGIAMASVMASILCDRATRSEVAMTGELTLSGEVLPIGGLKEKLIAAFKAGIKTALIPVKNYERDLDEIPAEVRENLNIVAVKNIAEVLEKNFTLEVGMKAGIIGLGLMGGSLGLALQEWGRFKSVIGYDHNALHAKLALTLGLVDECVEFEKILECDVIFLAIPVEGIIGCLKKMTSVKKNATIIDLGGAKAQIIRNIPKSIRQNFIAAHPMCGTEFYGPKASVKGLYENALVILCDLEDSGTKQVEIAKEIFLGVKARLIKMKSNEHDTHVAYISHLPHVLSYALANSILKQNDPEMILSLAGGGFRDMSRLSKSSPLMWKDIFKQNRDNVLEAIEKCEKEIAQAKAWIENNDYESLAKWMAQANKLQEFM